MVEFFIAVAFINAIVFTLMGLFIFLNDRKNKSNQIYSLFCSSVALWSVSYVFWLLSDIESYALFWARMLNVFAIFIPMFFCHWVFILLGIEKDKTQRIFLFLAYSATVFFTVFGFHPYYVSRVEPQFFFPYWPMPGDLHPYYLIISWGIILFYTYWQLYKSWRSSSGSRKTQLKYILISMPIGFGGGFTNFFLWYGIPFAPWLNILVSAWGVSFFYIVFRYSFMEVRSILSRSGIYALASLPIFLLSLGLFYASQSVRNSFNFFFLEIIFAFSSVLLFSWSLKFFERIAGRYFYNSFFGLQEKISFLSKKINQMIEMEKLSEFMASSLRDALKIEKTAIVLKSAEKAGFFVQKEVGLPEERIRPVLDLENGFLPFWLGKSGKALLREKIQSIVNNFGKEEAEILGPKFNKLKIEMEKNGVAVLTPLLVEGKLVGILFLGEKTAGKIYSGQEVDLLESLSAQASVAFNNSLAYVELEKGKEDLEKFYKLTIGREVRMAELKDQIKKMEEEKNYKKII